MGGGHTEDRAFRDAGVFGELEHELERARALPCGAHEGDASVAATPLHEGAHRLQTHAAAGRLRSVPSRRNAAEEDAARDVLVGADVIVELLAQ
jgi:hypothetical protein